MKKRNVPWRRLLAVLTSLMLVLTLLAPSAFAADPEPITLNKPDTDNVSWSGMTVTAYKVFSKVSTTAASGSEALYAVESPFKDFFNINGIKGSFSTASTGTETLYLYYDSNGNSLKVATTSDGVPKGATSITLPTTSTGALDPTYGEADLLSRITSDDEPGQLTAKNGNIATFYTWLEKYIKTAAPASLQPPVTVPANNPASVEIGVPADGYYALLFSNAPTGLSVIQGILVENGTDITMKAEEIPLTKQVKNTGSFGDSTTAEVGDTLEYRITTQVPDLADPGNLTQYFLEDTLTNQKLTGDLTLKVGSDTFTATIPTDQVGQALTASFTRTVSGPTGQTTETLATLTVNAYSAGSQSFKVDFLAPADSVWQNYQGQTVTLTYKATLTSAAVATNPNDVTLTFTNNNKEHKLTDHTVVHTYGIEVQKTFSDQRVTDEAVTFQLYRADNTGKRTGDALKLVKVGSGDGVYRLPDASEAATASITDLKLDANGKLTITGLDAATYWLVEAGVPQGFTQAKPIQIVLKASAADKANLDAVTSTAMYEGDTEDLLEMATTADTTSISLGKFIVRNQKGFDLPQTGSAGTWMFTVGGILLIAAAGALFLSSRKKNNSK